MQLMSALFAIMAEEAPKRPRPKLIEGISKSPNLVFWAVLILIAFGIGRKLIQWADARRCLRLLEGDRPHLDTIRDAANHGRAAVMDLFRLLATGKDEAVRKEAGRALATLWKRDELVAEEEKALVTRGFDARWTGRRKYPRGLTRPIPFTVEFGVPFLEENGPGVEPAALEWSARVLGSDRASLEQFDKWHAGGGKTTFEVDPRDRPTNGPHRVIIDVKVKTQGLTSDWEHELPQVPFTFEFDPILRPEALLASYDDERARRFGSAIRLFMDESDESRFLPIDSEFVLRGVPRLHVEGPLPNDLAHSVTLEITESTQTIDAGGVVMTRDRVNAQIPLEFHGEFGKSTLQKPGNYRMRAILKPDVHRGWCDPSVRSIWPGTIETEWVEVQVVRR